MSQEIEIDYHEDSDEYHVLLDGEDQGAVDEDSLREVGSNLHLHFVVYESAPPYDPDNQDVPDEVETREPEEILDIDEELSDIEEITDEISDIDEDGLE